ncbi:MAG: S1C family serine protease [Casimicrobiaceae bacterium]
MTDSIHWAFPSTLQPNADDVDFELPEALDAVVALRAGVPDDAFTAPLLGTERGGNGVVIDKDGLVLTIGYLITEADSVWLTTNAGTVVAGHALAYDQETGLGLVLPLGMLPVTPLARTSLAAAQLDGEVYVVSHGGVAHALRAKIVARREFAGHWEYLLDEALFTSPAHPEWSGAALLDGAGRLVGIGSLFVQEVEGEDTVKGNMFVPSELIDPILDELLRVGRANRTPRAWLGMYSAETRAGIAVQGVAEGGPAARAGVREGDIVRTVAGTSVNGLAEFYRCVWRCGSAGTGIPLTLSRGGAIREVMVASVDRSALLKKPSLQ